MIGANEIRNKVQEATFWEKCKYLSDFPFRTINTGCPFFTTRENYVGGIAVTLCSQWYGATVNRTSYAPAFKGLGLICPICMLPYFFLLCVWGQEIKTSFIFIVCSFRLARLEDMATRRTLFEDERQSPKIE